MNPVQRIEWLSIMASDADIPASALKAAILLAKHCNATTGLAWPGTRRHLGRDTARRGISWLKDHGWIIEHEQRAGMASIYKLTGGAHAPGANQPPVQISPRGGGTDAPGEGANQPPHEQVMEQVSEPVTLLPPTPAPAIAAASSEEEHACQPAPALTRWTFACKSNKTYTLPAALFARLEAAHPTIQLGDELDKAALWCETNPSKRKTVAGMPRFIAGWIGRAQPAPAAKSDFSMDQARAYFAGSDTE